MLTGVSLFAGVGGFDLAMERNGIKVVASVEIDKHARSILAARFPESQIFNDVREVTGNDLLNAGFVPDRGIITGGFPCQDLSVAGKRQGFSGERSSLFYEIARLADETKAKWLVLENVPGLLSSQRGADMGAVIGTLVDLGYGVAWRVLDAQHFGVPQRRRRVFIVAERAGDPSRPAQVLFKSESLRGDSSTGRKTRQETAGGAGQGVEVASVFEPMSAFEENWSESTVKNALRAGASKSSHAVVGPVRLYEPHHGDGRVTEDRANTLNARMGTGGNNLPVLIEETVYGQTGFAKYTEGATTLTATTHKRPEDNVVVRQDQESAERP